MDPQRPFRYDLASMKALASLVALATALFPFRSHGYPQALVDFASFKELVAQVESHRAQRLIDLPTFLRWSKEKGVVVLDARSEFRFKRKHLKGAVNLSFSDFTQANLERLIPDRNTKILIYCNNNFDGDPVDFATKVARWPLEPAKPTETQLLGNRKPLMLALNIPTYLNLYGYGYRNVYELHELVNVNDPRVEFAGSVVKK
jgi:hypothetical protein